MVLQLSREKLAMEIMPKVVAKEVKDAPAEAQKEAKKPEAKKPEVTASGDDSLLADLQDDDDQDDDNKAPEPQAKKQKTAPEVDQAYVEALAAGKNVKLKIDAS